MKRRDLSTILLSIIAHGVVFLLLYLNPMSITRINNQEVVIEVSSSVVVPEAQPEVEIKKPQKPTPAPTPVIPKESAPVIKIEKKSPPENKAPQILKEEKITKDIPKPETEAVKRDPVIEKNISPTPIPIEEPQKKAEVKDVLPEKKQAVLSEPAADVPKPVAPIVDKKNKEKDAPELAVAKPSASVGDTAPTSMTVNQHSATAVSGGSGANSSGAAAPASSAQAQVINHAPSSNLPSHAAAAPASSGALHGANSDAIYSSRDLNNKMPPYPVMAKKMRQEGTVVLMAEVLENGTAGDIRVSVTSGSELLDKVALETVKKWTFQPAKKDGVAYVQRLRIPITFKL